MAVILGNKYQSKNRDSFRKITGLSEANEKIKPENMPRIFGGIGEVYFNGQSAAGSSTGNGGGSGGGGGGGGGSGGGGGGGGGGECQCETLADALIINGIPCCVNGVDCETGTPIQIQLEPSSEPILPCKTTPAPPFYGDDTIVISYHNINCGSFFSTVYELSTMQSGAADAEAALSAAADTYRCIPSCGTFTNGDKFNLETVSKNGQTFQYYGNQRLQSTQCGVFDASCNVIMNYSQAQYYAGLENWNKKNQQKQYFVKDGKFYDVCDPYGKPPSSEPITMCDENGNQYSVSPDGKITPL